MHLEKRFLLIVFLLILPISFANPSLFNVTTDKTNYNISDQINFTAYFSSSSDIKLLIDDSSSFNNCNYSTQTGCLASSSNSSSSPIIANYNASSSGTITWFAKICDTLGNCDEGTNNYTFSGITSPSTSHIAYEGYNGSSIPPAQLLSGIEAITSDYSNLSMASSTYWTTENNSIDNHTWQRFSFKLNNPFNGTVIYNGDSDYPFATGYVDFYSWNYSSNNWVFLDNTTGSTISSILSPDFFNTSSCNFLAYSKRGIGLSNVKTDYIKLNVNSNISGTYTINTSAPISQPLEFNKSLTIEYNIGNGSLSYDSKDRLTHARYNDNVFILASESEPELISSTSSLLKIKTRQSNNILISWTNDFKNFNDINDNLVGQSFNYGFGINEKNKYQNKFILNPTQRLVGQSFEFEGNTQIKFTLTNIGNNKIRLITTR